jgi:hypothetical protein
MKIFVSYGAKPNTLLIFLYGFVQEDNPLDSIDFYFGESILILRIEIS